MVDLSGSGNNGTLTDLTRSDTGKYGRGLVFAGSGSEAFSVPDAASLDLSDGPLTIELWFKRTRTGWSEWLIHKGEGGYGLRISGATNKVSFTKYDTDIVASTVAVTDNKWHHVAATKNGSQVKLYLDGVDRTGMVSNQTLSNNSTELEIGPQACCWPTMRGAIDELRIYNRILSPGEVQTDMVTPLSTLELGEPVPTATTGYDPDTGRPTTTTADGRTITTAYDDHGRPISYTDADGNTSTTSYDAQDRPTSRNDGKGTQAYSYDSTTGLLTGMTDSHAGSFSASYDADGRMTQRTYPNGLRADVEYDTEGSPTRQAYVKTSCSSNCTWYEENVEESVHGQWRQRTVTGVSPPANGTAPGLVAAYGFEEGSGNTVADASGQGNTGTSAGASWATGKFGKALSFDGVDDIVTVADSNSLDLTTGMTLEAWVKPDVVTSARTVLMKERSPNLSYGLYAAADPNGPRADGPAALDSPTSLPTGKWTHLAVTYNGSTLKIWVNGNVVASKATTASMVAGSGPLRIGSNTLWNERFDGLIDEVRVYNRPLTEAELENDMDTAVAAPLPNSGPVAAYAFDEGSGTAVADASGQGNGGTFTGASWTTSGKFGSSRSFDGVDDMVTVADSSSLDLTSGMTLEAWVKPDVATAYRTVLFKERGGDNLSYALYTNSDPNGPNADGPSFLSAPNALPTGTWSHLAATFDGSTLKLWVNGEVVASQAGSTMTTGTGPLRIGANTVFGGEDFDGLIDEVRIYNRALTKDELEADMANPVAPELAPAPDSMAYRYDAAGRLTSVQDWQAGGCTTRTYAYDANSNRQTKTTRLPTASGACNTGSTGDVQSSTYDAADRITNSGFSYDSFGRITTVPASHSGGGPLHTSYYANDMVRSQTQDGVTKAWLLDPTGVRYRATVPNAGNQEILHYADDSDAPTWTAHVVNGTTTSWSRTIEGIDGDLAAIYDSQSASATFQLTNLHGDVIATAGSNSALTAPSARFDADEFGVPKYSNERLDGWLGGKQRRTQLSSGVVQMGVRSYVPAMGRFTSVDLITGASANAYDYALQDPVNQMDLDGRCPWCIPVAGALIRWAVTKVGSKAVRKRLINKNRARSEALRQKVQPIEGVTHHGIIRLVRREITVRQAVRAVRDPAVRYSGLDAMGRPYTQYWGNNNILVVLNARNKIVMARVMNRAERRRIWGPNG